MSNAHHELKKPEKESKFKKNQKPSATDLVPARPLPRPGPFCG
jgi:hypothetical protein